MSEQSSFDELRHMPVASDLRKNPRLATTIEAVLLPPYTHTQDCLILNISMGGLLFITDGELEVGRYLQIRIHQPLCPEAQVFAIHVIHVSRATNRPMTYLSTNKGQSFPSGGYLTGVTFTNLSAIQRGYIANFLTAPPTDTHVDIVAHAMLANKLDHQVSLEEAPEYNVSLFLSTLIFDILMVIAGVMLHLPFASLAVGILGVTMAGYGVRLALGFLRQRKIHLHGDMALMSGQEAAMLNDSPEDTGDPFMHHTAS